MQVGYIKKKKKKDEEQNKVTCVKHIQDEVNSEPGKSSWKRGDLKWSLENE